MQKRLRLRGKHCRPILMKIQTTATTVGKKYEDMNVDRSLKGQPLRLPRRLSSSSLTLSADRLPSHPLLVYVNYVVWKNSKYGLLPQILANEMPPLPLPPTQVRAFRTVFRSLHNQSPLGLICHLVFPSPSRIPPSCFSCKFLACIRFYPLFRRKRQAELLDLKYLKWLIMFWSEERMYEIMRQ